MGRLTLDIPTELGAKRQGKAGRSDVRERQSHGRRGLATPPEERFASWVETWAQA